MASVNRSCLSVRISAPPEKHEVFISFRGEDTRKGFTSHLNATFKRHNIRNYIDLNPERDNKLSTNHVRAIEDAKLSVIVFSKNYADSKRCLDELVKIVECKKKKDQMIVPVFYNVNPNSVRWQKESYADALSRHEKTCKEKVQIWVNAFKEACSYSGWDWSINDGTEHEIVEKIAKDVVEKLDRVYFGDMDPKLEQLEELARFLGDCCREGCISEVTETNHKATLERIKRQQVEKKFRMLRLTPDLLSHMEISPATNTYF